MLEAKDYVKQGDALSIAKVIGDSINANNPNTTSHTGMIARRLNSIDMVVTAFLPFAGNEGQDGRGRPC